MGLATWVSISGTDDQALEHGEIVANVDELQSVVLALRQYHFHSKPHGRRRFLDTILCGFGKLPKPSLLRDLFAMFSKPKELRKLVLANPVLFTNQHLRAMEQLRLDSNSQMRSECSFPNGRIAGVNVDMILIDMDLDDPFDFYLDHYREQLVAGYTKTTPRFGLRVNMRDFDKLHRGAMGSKERHQEKCGKSDENDF